MTPDILILKPSSLGDIVHTLPSLAFMRAAMPTARIVWLANVEWAPLLEGNSMIDEVIRFPRGEFRGMRGLTRLPTWLAGFSKIKPLKAFDFQGLLRSALLARVAGSREILGLSDAREGSRMLYHSIADVSGIPHAVDRYLALTRHAGFATTGEIQFPLPPGIAIDGLPSEGFVALHPFARGVDKSLSADSVRAFVERMAPTPVVIVGRGKTEIAPLSNAIDLLNRTTLPELIGVLRKADFTVSVDSGPMHIAAALGPRVMALHGWSDPRKVGPYNRDAWVWRRGEVRRVAELDAPFCEGTAMLPDVSAMRGIVELVQRQRSGL